MISIAEAARAYLAGGISLVPCGAEKRPVIDGWKVYQSRRPTRAELEGWIERGVESFAAVGGAVSGGLEIIDFDDNPDAQPTGYSAADIWNLWLAQVGHLLAGLPFQRTGGGGYQIAYRCPQPGGNEKLAWVPDEREHQGRSVAIETRGEGGYALVAPSLHPSGNYYTMLAGDFASVPTIDQGTRDQLIHAARVLDLMPYTAQQLAPAKAERRAARRPMNGDVSVIDAYNDAHRISDVLARNGYTAARPGRYSRPGKPDSYGVAILERDNVSFHWSSNDPLHKTTPGGQPVPIDPFDAYALFEHGDDYGAAVKAAARSLGIARAPQSHANGARAVGDASAPEWAVEAATGSAEASGETAGDDSYLLTYDFHDEGNAQTVHRRYDGEFLHSESLGWMHYNGRYWTRTEAEAAVDRAIIETLVARMGAAARDKQESDVLRKFVPSAGHVRGAKYLLTSIVSASPDNFDANPDLLNCKNGVVDLRTGELTPHSSAQRFLHCTTADYKPDADQTIWGAWLAGAVGLEMESWLQLAVGYSLTGHTREEIMFYLFGPPRSGKGTFTETLLTVLGEPLGSVISFHLLTAQREVDSQNFALAPLHGARFVAASESNQYERFNEAKVKTVTGGDTIQVAYKHKDPFNYRPKYKIFLSSNQPVNADPDDDAVWGRIRLVEFPHSYLGTEDKALKYDMRSRGVLEGVLAWAVEGAMKWYALGRAGLPELDRSRQVKAGHRAELDNVQAWLDENCTPATEAFTAYRLLYTSYADWCKANGVEPKKQKGFSQSLITKGYQPKTVRVDKGTAKGFTGLRLL
jgi:putative DNA primase/helicase